MGLVYLYILLLVFFFIFVVRVGCYREELWSSRGELKRECFYVDASRVAQREVRLQSLLA